MASINHLCLPPKRISCVSGFLDLDSVSLSSGLDVDPDLRFGLSLKMVVLTSWTQARLIQLTCRSLMEE